MSHVLNRFQSPKSRLVSCLGGFSLGVTLLAGVGCGGPEGEEAGQGPALATTEAALSTGTLGCYIDTPAYDYPTAGGCEGYSTSQTYITFEMINAGSGYTYHWQDSRCFGTGPFCSIMASPNSSIFMTVYIKDSAGTTVDTQGAYAVLYYGSGM